MAFYSQHATRIWEDLYTVMIPEQVTQNAKYLRVYGTYSSGNKDIDRMMETALTTVKIPIIKMLEYYNDGVPIQIPKRESMLEIHRSIEMYLGEWRHHIENAINSDLLENKDLVIGLEKLSKMIYGKATDKEIVINPRLTVKMGLINPLTQMNLERETISKPDYNGIGQLIRQKTKVTRY